MCIRDRESYLRRAEGDRLWLVDRAHLITGSPDFVAPNADKPHRHNDGDRIAERRRRLRETDFWDTVAEEDE